MVVCVEIARPIAKDVARSFMVGLLEVINDNPELAKGAIKVIIQGINEANSCKNR